MQINKLFHENSKVPVEFLSQETIDLLKEQKFDSRAAKQQKLVHRFQEGIRKRFPLVNVECLSDDEEAWIRKYARRCSSEDPIRTLILIGSVSLEPDKSLEVKLRWHARNKYVLPSAELFDLSRQAMESVDGLVEYWRDAPQDRSCDKSTAEDIADLLLLIMIKKLISEPDLAFTYLFALVFCSVAFRRGQAVAYLDDELKPIPRNQLVDHNLKSTRKILADREALHLLKRLSQKSPKQIENSIASGHFSNALKRRLSAAKLSFIPSLDERLIEFGRRLSSLRGLCLPPFVRELHTAILVTAPQCPFWEYFFTTKSTPINLPLPSVDARCDEVIDRVMALTSGESISDEKFYDFQLEWQSMAEKSPVKGVEKRRGVLLQILEDGLTDKLQGKSLSPCQRLQYQFHWFLAYWGIPSSEKNPEVGVLKTIRSYIQQPANIISEAYRGSPDWEISEERWGEVLKAAIERGDYDKDRADRLALFFGYMDRGNLIDPLSKGVIYDGVTKIKKQPLNQLIPMNKYLVALELAAELPSGDIVRAMLALFIGLFFGARFDEVWNAKYFQLVISRSKISFCIGGRGNDPAKSTAGNRPCLLMSELPELVRNALKNFLELRNTVKPSSNEYIFHTTEMGHRDVERARFSRLLNRILKTATGNPKARFHDLRKTSINAFVLAVHRNTIKHPYLKYLLESGVFPNFNLPDSICAGGSRFAYWAQACTEMYGHSTFVDVTTYWYVVYASEFYDHYTGMLGIGEKLRSCMKFLSRGELDSTSAINEHLRGTDVLELPKFCAESTYKRGVLQNLPLARTIEINPHNVFHVLQEGKPVHMGWLEASAADNQAVISEIRETASRLGLERSFAHQHIDPDPIGADSTEEPFFTAAFPINAVTDVTAAFQHVPQNFYAASGIWAMAYRNMGKYEVYVLEHPSDLSVFLDHLHALGFDMAALGVKCVAGGAMHAVLERSKMTPTFCSNSDFRRFGPRNAWDPVVIKMGRGVNASIHTRSFFSKAGFLCHVVQVLRDGQKG